MPESKKRVHPHHNMPPHRKKKNNHAIIYVAVIFFALLGAGISYLTGNTAASSLIIGAVAGGIAGFFFGYQIDKSLTGK